ncbi:methyltransferase domain-containing protein [Colletotrichum nymphaeae SA-01]|uniref:Methyltransferase domain-containing protein n=1 Tax=Colletotrichum nymphaeae SA-01 TaxID=1460502 RepID=A0A135TII9_9PEZI|nr:methyltransferase domain-containing protein [Colletotrichum nymphaeae SA-01]
MSDASGFGHAAASQDEDALPTLTLEQTMALLIQDFVHGRAQLPPPLSLPLPLSPPLPLPPPLPATIHDTATTGNVALAPGVPAVSEAGASDRDSLHETEAADTADENDHENENNVASDDESEISIDAPAAPPATGPFVGFVPSLHSITPEYATTLFIEENGRTYNSARDQQYPLPNDLKEQDRLDLQHQCWLRTSGEVLCFCPKRKRARRVLDVGTGTGVWAIGFADMRAEAEVIGVDISPIQPHSVPANCSFEIDDVEREWVWPDYFDFIFVRHMNACFASWPDFLARAFNHLEPGGFIELHDNAFPIICPDNTMPPTSAIARWSAMLMEATSAIGRPIDAPRHFKAMLEEAGFEAVVEKKRLWPVSPWHWDPKMRALGWWVQAGSLAGLEASILKLGTGVLGWSRSEVLEFCEEVKTELREARVHGYWEV